MERVCSLITASHNGLLRKENHQSKEQIKICMFMTNPSFFLVLDPPPSCINSFWLKPFFALNVAWERLQATPATVPGNSHTMRALVKTGVFSEGIFRFFECGWKITGPTGAVDTSNERAFQVEFIHVGSRSGACVVFELWVFQNYGLKKGRFSWDFHTSFAITWLRRGVWTCWFFLRLLDPLSVDTYTFTRVGYQLT